VNRRCGFVQTGPGLKPARRATVHRLSTVNLYEFSVWMLSPSSSSKRSAASTTDCFCRLTRCIDAVQRGVVEGVVREILGQQLTLTSSTPVGCNKADTSAWPMNESKVWLITGAGRGLGVDIAKGALATGHAVVATGRDATKVSRAIGEQDHLLTSTLDVTRPRDAQAAVETAVAKFGRIDILVNNAGNFFAGFFEELSPEQVRNQIETLLFGPMNVTRAVLPVMRKQRSGLVLTISSTAGIAGQMFCAAYAAAKFGIEGWMESLTPEIAPFGIRTMLVEPGFFRTELLTNDSTTYAQPTIDDPWAAASLLIRDESVLNEALRIRSGPRPHADQSVDPRITLVISANLTR
jgi:NAD(P)-dependent dehydrogenase (short-subunit alcohol dehydrogenase family)